MTTVTFAPAAPGVYEGILTVNGDVTGGTNTIRVSGSAYPDLRGGWVGTSTFSSGGTSSVRNENWSVTDQVGTLFSGTRQLTPSATTPLQSGTMSGSVAVAGDIPNLKFVVIGGLSSCARLVGDGVFNGALSGTTISLQMAETIRCPGQAELSRTTTVSMRTQ